MGAGYEVEPNLRDSAPAGRLWGPDDPRSAEADQVSLEQRRLASLLQTALAEDRADFATRIIRGLASTEVWESFGITQAEGQVMKRLIEQERGGNWKIAGVLAIGDAGNTADVLVTLTDLVGGFTLRATAKRTDQSELGLNLPLRSADGSFSMQVTGGAAGDRALVLLRLQRTGAQVGGK